MAKILNVGNHAIDLDDGRTLAPGEEADGIDVDSSHNKSVIDQGLALVVETQPAGKSKAERTTGEEGKS